MKSLILICFIALIGREAHGTPLTGCFLQSQCIRLRVEEVDGAACGDDKRFNVCLDWSCNPVCLNQGTDLSPVWKWSCACQKDCELDIYIDGAVENSCVDGQVWNTETSDTSTNDPFYYPDCDNPADPASSNNFPCKRSFCASPSHVCIDGGKCGDLCCNGDNGGDGVCGYEGDETGLPGQCGVSPFGTCPIEDGGVHPTTDTTSKFFGELSCEGQFFCKEVKSSEEFIFAIKDGERCDIGFAPGDVAVCSEPDNVVVSDLTLTCEQNGNSKAQGQVPADPEPSEGWACAGRNRNTECLWKFKPTCVQPDDCQEFCCDSDTTKICSGTGALASKCECVAPAPPPVPALNNNEIKDIAASGSLEEAEVLTAITVLSVIFALICCVFGIGTIYWKKRRDSKRGMAVPQDEMDDDVEADEVDDREQVELTQN